MIIDVLNLDRADFETRTGWELKPEGACKGDICIPLGDVSITDTVDVARVAEKLRMPLVADDEHGIWSLGPQWGGKALESAHAPDLTLPDWHGQEFRLHSLRGQKIFLLAWASW